MTRVFLKFKPGSGQIIAFLILAFVFASMAGVVYVVISGSGSKTPEAAGLNQAADLRVSDQICDSSGKVNMVFSWKPGGQGRVNS